MTETVGTAAGATFSIGTTSPTPLSDSYTQVGETNDIGQFGRVYTEIKYANLSDRNVRKFKGTRDDGTIKVKLGRFVGDDAGQDAVGVALDDDHDYNFKIVLNDASGTTGSHGTEYFFSGKVMSFPTTIGGPNNVVMLEFDVGIHSGTIQKVAAT